MGINLKNAEVEALARRLATATGESMTGAIAVALRERLDRLDRADEEEKERRKKEMTSIARDAGRRWVEPYASSDHGDLLYDERGLPR